MVRSDRNRKKDKYKARRRERGCLFLSARKMKSCREEIKYCDKAIRIFVNRVAKPSIKNKKFIGGVHKAHAMLVTLNYCATQLSEDDMKSNFDLKRESSMRNLKTCARECAWYIREHVWKPKITSEFKDRANYSYDNFGDIGGKDFRHVTWNIDGKPTRCHKFKRTDSEGNKLSQQQLRKYYYDYRLKAPGKRFIALRSSNEKWRGMTRSCYPSGAFSEAAIIKGDKYAREWFSLMNPRDCVGADSGLGPSIRKLLKNSDEYYYEDEEDPAIDETRVNYPPQIKETYPKKVTKKLENIKKAHKKFGKKNIERAWGNLVNKNPGILSKYIPFRTDDGVFQSNLIQVVMQMQNIEESLTDEEREEEEKEYMLKLYNGEVSFGEEDNREPEEDDEDEDDDEEESNIEQLLGVFEKAQEDLLQQYEDENVGSQMNDSFSQTNQ